MQWCEYKQLLGESRFGSGSSKEGHKKMIVGLQCVGGREWWVPGSRALRGSLTAYQKDGIPSLYIRFVLLRLNSYQVFYDCPALRESVKNSQS